MADAKFGIHLIRSTPSRSVVIDIERIDDLAGGGDMDYAIVTGFVNERKVFEDSVDVKPGDDGVTALARGKVRARELWKAFDDAPEKESN